MMNICTKNNWLWAVHEAKGWGMDYKKKKVFVLVWSFTVWSSCVSGPWPYFEIWQPLHNHEFAAPLKYYIIINFIKLHINWMWVHVLWVWQLPTVTLLNFWAVILLTMSSSEMPYVRLNLWQEVISNSSYSHLLKAIFPCWNIAK